MNENIKAFFEKVQADKELQAKFAKLKNPEETYKLAASVQGGFTKEELFAEVLKRREEEGISEEDIARVADLSDEDLASVAGGVLESAKNKYAWII